VAAILAWVRGIQGNGGTSGGDAMTLKLTDLEYRMEYQAHIGYEPLPVAYISTHYGLGIAQEIGKKWQVIHLASGDYLLKCTTRRNALASLNALLGAGLDWTVSEWEMNKIKYRGQYTAAVKAAREKWGEKYA
jgi:hypothetical protein